MTKRNKMSDEECLKFLLACGDPTREESIDKLLSDTKYEDNLKWIKNQRKGTTFRYDGDLYFIFIDGDEKKCISEKGKKIDINSDEILSNETCTILVGIKRNYIGKDTMVLYRDTDEWVKKLEEAMEKTKKHSIKFP